MSSRYAIFGATGNTGRGILARLLDKNVEINVYVRSRSKLTNLFPSIDSNEHVHIFEGDISDLSLVTQMLKDVSVTFLTLGQNDNRPGTDVVTIASHSIVKALRKLSNEQKNFSRPRLILLSSASWNENLHRNGPTLITRLIRTAFYYSYQDLLQGQKTLLGCPDLVKVTLMQPGALIDEEPSGYDLTIDTSGVSCSYSDLSAAFVEIATEERYQDVSAIMVTSKTGYDFGRHASELLPKVAKGVAASYIPGFWPFHDYIVSWAS